MRISLTQIAIIVVGALVIIAAIWFGVSYFTTGVLRVETGQNARVERFEIAENSQQARKLGTGPLVSQRLDPGTYTVTAENAEGETRTVVTVQKRQTTQVQLKVEEAGKFQELTFGNAYNIVSQGGRLRFLDRNLKRLYQLEAAGQRPENVFPGLSPVSAITWAGYDSAFVELENNTYKALAGGNVKPFRYPPDARPSTDNIPNLASHDINDRGQMAVNIDGSLYRYPSVDGKPDKLRDLPSQSSQIALSSTGSMFIFHPPATGENSQSQPNNLIVGSQASLPDALKNRHVLNGEWSPSGNKLLLAKKNGLHVYNKAKQQLSRVMQFLPDNADSLLWRDENRLLMVDDGAVWQLHIGEQKWRKMADTPDPVRHNNPLTLGQDGRTLYMGTTSQGLQNSGSLYQLRLPQ
jgi:hypothetical protein